MKIQRLIDYLAGRAPLKRALEDKEKALEAGREEKNCLMTENDFLKKEKDVLTGEKNKQYQTIQELLEDVKRLSEALRKSNKALEDEFPAKKILTQKQKTTLPGRVAGKGKAIRGTGATGKGVKLNKQ